MKKKEKKKEKFYKIHESSIRCHFCYRERQQLEDNEHLISSNYSFICSKCIMECFKILEDEKIRSEVIKHDG